VNIEPKQLYNFLDHNSGSYYFYDLELLKKKAALITQGPDWLKIWYACKANPNSVIIKTLQSAGIGVDCASLGEIRHCQANGVKPDHIITTGPARDLDYFRQALKLNVETFVLESFNQLESLHLACEESNQQVRALLRIQLNWEGEKADILGGCETTAFGLDREQWEKIKPNEYPTVDIIGAHIFQWGNILSVDRLKYIWSYSAQEAKLCFDHLDLELKVLDLGGGLGVPYGKDQQALDWEKVTEALAQVRSTYQLNDIWMELGRYLVAEIGSYLTKVMDQKRVRSKNFLILSGGINHLLRSMATGQHFPVQNIKGESGEQNRFFLHGPLCTALDFLGEHELNSDTSVGDYLVFSWVGAYGFTESMPYFLCHELAGEVAIESGQMNIIRKVENPEVWMK
jgi:diaminopimelate decarboxylase